MQIHRFAMRGNVSDLSDPADLAEHARTEHVLDAGGRRLLAGLMRQTAATPRQFAAALRLAHHRAAAGRSSLSRQIIYMAEGARTPLPAPARWAAIPYPRISAPIRPASPAMRGCWVARASALPSTARECSAGRGARTGRTPPGSTLRTRSNGWIAALATGVGKRP